MDTIVWVGLALLGFWYISKKQPQSAGTVPLGGPTLPDIPATRITVEAKSWYGEIVPPNPYPGDPRAVYGGPKGWFRYDSPDFKHRLYSATQPSPIPMPIADGGTSWFYSPGGWGLLIPM